MNPNTQRALLLLEHSRSSEAEEQARLALQQNPDDAFALAVLALCLAAQKKHKEALMAAHQAVGKEPDVAYFHWVLAKVLLLQDQNADAFRAIEYAIRLDPEDADYHALKAAILVDRKKWTEAMAALQRGLEVEPEHEDCINLRSICLTNLGLNDHAGTVLDDALSRNPDNAFTHANKGWVLLHSGKYRQAETHFREALRLEPDLEHARLGILQSLRSRHFFYRTMLRYFLWMSRFTGKSQLMIIFGLWLGFRALRGISKQIPSAQTFIIPILVVYGVFVYLSWTAVPLSDLLLLLHPLGRLALTREEKRNSAIVGLTLFSGLAGLGAGFAIHLLPLVIFGVLCILMVIPLSATLAQPPGNSRLFLMLYTAGLWVAGLAYLLVDSPQKNTLLVVFLLGFFVFSWVANLVSVRS